MRDLAAAETADRNANPHTSRERAADESGEQLEERDRAFEDNSTRDAMLAAAERERLREAVLDADLTPSRQPSNRPEGGAFKASAERANDAATGWRTTRRSADRATPRR